MLTEAQANRLATWAQEQSKDLVARNKLGIGSPLESELLDLWRKQRPDLIQAMSGKGALRQLAHVLVDRSVEEELALLREGMPPSDAWEEAVRAWWMLDETAIGPSASADLNSQVAGFDHQTEITGSHPEPAELVVAPSPEKHVQLDSLEYVGPRLAQRSDRFEPDPILMKDAIEMTALYIEAGTRRFIDIARDFLASTGLTVDQAEEMLRLAYLLQRGNIRRDQSAAALEGMDNEDDVFAAIATLRVETSAAATFANAVELSEQESRTTTLAEIKDQILNYWQTSEPKVAKSQPQEWLERQAEAKAHLAMGEILTAPPFQSPSEAWSEVATHFLGPCPRKGATSAP